MPIDIINGQNGVIIFIEAAVDPVGHEERTKDSTNENYNKDLRSENPVEAFPSEAFDEIITCRSRFMEVRNKARSSELHKYFALHQYDRRSKKDVYALAPARIVRRWL